MLALVLGFSVFGQQNIFKNINSEYSEQNPVLSPDGRTLYFTRSNHPDNKGGRKDKGDIWSSELGPDHLWSAPKNVSALNNGQWNAVIGFSADGSVIYLYNHYEETNGIIKTQGIASAEKLGNKWSTPQDIQIPYFRNLSEIPGGSISDNGNVLVLSMESYGTYGGEDIYVSVKNNNGWSSPRNLGEVINTPYQEFSPFLSDDLKTLYFSSNGRGGKGSSDIFMSERLDDTWTNWSEPTPLDHLNTAGREVDYKVYDQWAVYASTINSDGYSDLKWYSDQPLDSLETNQLVVADSIDDVVDVKDSVSTPTEKAFVIYGSIMDDANQPVGAIIGFTREGFSREIPTNNGEYSIQLPESGKYEINVVAPGFMSESGSVIAGEEPKEENYILTPLKAGASVKLESVLFEQSTPNILPGSYEELEMVVDLMKHNPTMKIRVDGHTDNRGVPKHNLRLSKARAKAVEEYLIEQGIERKRISRKGFGGSKPIADNDDPELRKLNRRVEITILKE